MILASLELVYLLNFITYIPLGDILDIKILNLSDLLCSVLYSLNLLN